jgi:hypothetical protein
MFEVGSLAMVAGPPASMKSFLALDWMLCAASGRDWNGRKVTPAKVLYLLGEGKSGIYRRIQAWIVHHNPDPDQLQRLYDNFRVSFAVPQLANSIDIDMLLSDFHNSNYIPTLLVVDTLARTLVGKDENSSDDMGQWIAGLERLRQLGFTSLIVHHTKKDTENGYVERGSSALLGALDTSIVATFNKSTKRCKVQVSKQKEHDEGDPLYFNKAIIPLEGDLESSCVLIPDVLGAPDAPEVAKATPDTPEDGESLLDDPGPWEEQCLLQVVADSTLENIKRKAIFMDGLTHLGYEICRGRIRRAMEE